MDKDSFISFREFKKQSSQKDKSEEKKKIAKVVAIAERIRAKDEGRI